MSRALARRGHGRRGMRRARRNPGKSVAWGLLAVGAVVGAGTAVGAGYLINANASPPVATTTQTALNNAGTGAAVGLALAGIGGALMRHSGTTLLAGLATGGLLFGGLYLMNKPATATA